MALSFFYIMMSVSLLLAFLARSPRLQLLEEVVALVIYEDECREVLYGNLPDCSIPSSGYSTHSMLLIEL